MLELATKKECQGNYAARNFCFHFRINSGIENYQRFAILHHWYHLPCFFANHAGRAVQRVLD